MRKNLRITVDGHSYDVVVEDLDQAAEPAERPVAAAPAAPAAPAPAAPAPVAAPPPVQEAGPGAIAAPIGGVVRSIDVAIGGVIAVGDKIATIEAMKMKTEVISHVAGKVVNIAAQVGASVETGQVLMTLE
jgi:biotin carboxyl carrier protein